MRASHASAVYMKDGPTLPKAVKKERYEKGRMIKGRNESSLLPCVAHVVARVKGVSLEEVAEA